MKRACAGCSSSLPRKRSLCESSLVSLAVSPRYSSPDIANEDQHTDLSPRCPEAQAALSSLSLPSAFHAHVPSQFLCAHYHSFPKHCAFVISLCSTSPIPPSSNLSFSSISDSRIKQESTINHQAAPPVSSNYMAPIRLQTDPTMLCTVILQSECEKHLQTQAALAVPFTQTAPHSHSEHS